MVRSWEVFSVGTGQGDLEVAVGLILYFWLRDSRGQPRHCEEGDLGDVGGEAC